MAKRVKILLLVISLSLTLSLMSNTYSRYIADTTGNVEVLFSKWQIMVNENDITTNSNSSIELIPVIEENTNIKANTIAPSSKGYFDIDINPTNVGVSFDYTISLSLQNDNIPDLMITKYSVIDNEHPESNNLLRNTINGNKITGSLDYDNTITNFTFEPFTIRVYFEWYEGTGELMNDEADTLIATSTDTNPSLNIVANITFSQKLTTATSTDSN